LLPAILWSTETWLTSAIAYDGWFHASDCAALAFPSGAPATRVFSIRFAPKSFSSDVPALGFDRCARRLVLDACESKAKLAGPEQEGQTLASSRPSRTSPSSLVARPGPCVTRFADRHIANLNQFTSIVNPAATGVAPSASASASAEEHQPMLALPQFTALGLSFAFRQSLQATAKAPSIEFADREDADAGSRPHPSPVRAQPASMLVLPGSSSPVNNVKWGASAGWATVTSPSLSKQRDVRMSLSQETSVSSLRVGREQTQGLAPLHLNPRRPAISLDLGAQTCAPGVPTANALPRRRGPKLPVVTSELGELTVAGD
jgi:hypothetical protein